VIIIIGCLYIGLLSPLNTGILQGLQRFLSLSIISVGASFLKLFFGILLVSLGLKLNGAMLAFLISGFILFFIPFYYTRDLPKSAQTIDDLGIGNTKFIRSTVPIIFVTLFIMLLTNIDLVMVKHFFPKEDAGIYAAVSVLGRTVFYVPGSIVMVMFPIVSEGRAQRANLIPILKKALWATLFIGGFATIVLLLFPQKMLSFLFGTVFSKGSTLLRPFAISMFFMSFLNLLANYNLAIDNHKFIPIMFVGCLAEIVLIFFFHQSKFSVIFILMVISFSLLILLLYQTFSQRVQIN
tara:strand:- start:392 stop:1276 length:885 start_codon:yes stop_codon:yes gene_type:complete